MSRRAAKVVTDRDREVLRFIGKGGVASVAQIHAAFWGLSHEDTAADRLGQLAQAGWVERHGIDTRRRGEIVYTLTPSGAQHFTRPERERFIIGLPLRAELKQQLMAQDARIALERLYAARGFRLWDWQNERELRRAYLSALSRAGTGRGIHRGRVAADIADARATFVHTATGERAEVDIEIDGAYFGVMLHHKIDQFANRSTQGVWVTSPARASRIAELFAPYPHISVLAL